MDQLITNQIKATKYIISFLKFKMFVKISFLVALFVLLAEGRNVIESIVEDHDHSIGTKWAVLVAGSNNWYNYRHQVIYIYNSFLTNLIFYYSLLISMRHHTC